MGNSDDKRRLIATTSSKYKGQQLYPELLRKSREVIGKGTHNMTEQSTNHSNFQVNRVRVGYIEEDEIKQDEVIQPYLFV